ncbi:MAG: NADH-ubiquinone oxidoreductase-F iron-sulfur binding region domain-containing protein [Nanoarchaeota archaeon]|nr:NADH-ubiquinone oxidoreductase-F iron-sulfur binding region domain-containing protein [Nanoarchaeota archaeon]
MQILRETKLEGLRLAKKIRRKKVLEILLNKNLGGHGGANFSVAKKWGIALNIGVKERYVICNADEGEPGTFKDKFILKNNPETMIEGLLIAAYVLKAKRCFIYLRGEYDYLREELEKKVKEMLKKSKMKVSIEIVRGAGAYICGEETAIIQSIMGNRGNAMYKPPRPTIEGLWGKPTVINNVETLTCVPQALVYDDWNPDYRLFSISGDVSHPGVYEWELGVKMSTILDIVKPKGKLKAMSFGCFGGIMPVDKNFSVSQDSICKGNCQHGAFSIIFIGERHNIVDICLSIAKFYTYESCGKCTPCREGTIRLVNLLKKIKSKKADKSDLKLLKEFAEHIQETSLCGLGQSCGNHILTSLKHFKKDYMECIK